MKIEEVLSKIILMPQTLKLQNISIYELLKETGYFQVYNKITKKIIHKKLSQFSEHIDEWIIYSEDKRTDSGCFIKQDGKDYLVGFITKEGKSKQKKYMDKIKALATFIKYEIENIRNG
ncbi:hypothetical protein KAR91_02970 [Candidatus Pacearchaeota archaeon]|nr:hypothetical protein [Candidatus Pacearchaeota archaeon]